MNLPVALTSGTVIGSQYVIGDLINHGGFGAVYRGADTGEGNRPCAIKETYNVTPAARRQALMEASVLLTVRSKHLPEVYDAFEANGRFYLVMQLIEGKNLLQILRDRVPSGLVGESAPYQQTSGPCSESEVLAWLLPIVEVLQDLHSRNPPIIHRDIKPGNIILTPQQTAVLVDFGLTKLYDPVETTRTMIKAVSEGFSPIEQYVGKTCPQSDIYAMAATMYLLLTNKLPSSSLSRAMHDDLRSPRVLNPALSPKMDRVLLKALAVNADERHQSMREFVEALREPIFSAYADITVAFPPVQANSGMGHLGSHPSSYTNSPTPPPPPASVSNGSSGPAYQRQSPTRPGANYQKPHPVSSSQSPQGSPGPGPRMAPPMQKRRQPASSWRRLPDPANQGCLWGGLQGIVGALVVLSGGNSGFYVSTLMALFCYAFAGFMTTRRGGGFLRGGRAGYHTCIIGTLFFWISLGVGLAIRFGQVLNASNISSGDGYQNSSQIANAVWRDIQPSWHSLLIMPEKSPLINVLIWAVGGIILAWVLGWIGGWLGTMRYQSRPCMRHPKH
jgi:serine/threonine protein kinase